MRAISSLPGCFIPRAQHEARLFDRSRRTLEWLNTVQGGGTVKINPPAAL